MRKHDRVSVTEEEDRKPDAHYFNEDGNKLKDVEFVGERSPDTDPEDRSLDPNADPEPEPLPPGRR